MDWTSARRRLSASRPRATRPIKQHLRGLPGGWIRRRLAPEPGPVRSAIADGFMHEVQERYGFSCVQVKLTAGDPRASTMASATLVAP
jgi:hypothetical protein